jgi:hypothetical protein
MDSEYTLDERLRIVVAAAEVFGKPRARKLWRVFGLPETGQEQRMLNLDAFVEEMIEPAPGGIVFARPLYQAYVAWCAARGERPASEKLFGTELPRNGVVKLRKRVREYRDIQLKEMTRASSPQQQPDAPDLWSLKN